MKKRISCKVIKSIPLGNTDGFCPNILNTDYKSLYFDDRLMDSEVIIYTRNLKIKKESDINSINPAINFLA